TKATSSGWVRSEEKLWGDPVSVQLIPACDQLKRKTGVTGISSCTAAFHQGSSRTVFISSWNPEGEFSTFPE
ncbi:hypothetical protein AMECASPLE_032047, partial [Ameca splendens]